MNPVHSVTLLECEGDGGDALVAGMSQFPIYIGNLHSIPDEPVHPLSYHSETFLDRFLKTAPNTHHLPHGFHRRAQFLRDPFEFSQIPPGDFADHIIKRRFKTSGCDSGDRIGNLIQAIAQSELGGYRSERISRSLGCQGGRPAQAGVNLDNPVVIRFRIQGILYIALPDDSHSTDNLDRKFAQPMIFVVAESL